MAQQKTNWWGNEKFYKEIRQVRAAFKAMGMDAGFSANDLPKILGNIKTLQAYVNQMQTYALAKGLNYNPTSDRLLKKLGYADHFNSKRNVEKAKRSSEVISPKVLKRAKALQTEIAKLRALGINI